MILSHASEMRLTRSRVIAGASSVRLCEPSNASGRAPWSRLSVMRNVLELSADQTAYTRWVPLGAARYELIADAYALDAASEVRQP